MLFGQWQWPLVHTFPLEVSIPNIADHRDDTVTVTTRNLTRSTAIPTPSSHSLGQALKMQFREATSFTGKLSPHRGSL